MGETESGLPNAEYAEWMASIASQDCQDVEELYVKLTSGSETTYTESSVICQLMQNATEEQVAGYYEVKFSGHNSDDELWYATDKRLTTNLERTVNYADVPANIKRPPGA